MRGHRTRAGLGLAATAETERWTRETDEPAVPRPNTFPREARITKKLEFQFVFEQGQKLVGREFVCYWVRCEGQGSKLGFAVSRKVGNAVVRNRVKRRIREFFRTHRGAFQAPVQLVVVARPPSATLSHSECVDALKRLLQRGGILHG